MKEKIKREDGVIIVEATFIFPIIFLIVILMIFVGNAYFQKSKVESIVTKMAYYGSAQCADPLLKYVQNDGKVPEYGSDYKIQPYRYLLGGMNTIESDVANQIRSKASGIGTGLFGGMEPDLTYLNVKFNNAYIYSTFSVEVQYKIPIPMRLPGMNENFAINMSSRCDVPVSDTPEFIRNVDMVEDWLESSGLEEDIKQKTQGIMDKIDPFINFIN